MIHWAGKRWLIEWLQTYGEMWQLVEHNTDWSWTIYNYLARQGSKASDVLEIMHNIHIFVASYMYVIWTFRSQLGFIPHTGLLFVVSPHVLQLSPMHWKFPHGSSLKECFFHIVNCIKFYIWWFVWRAPSCGMVVTRCSPKSFHWYIDLLEKHLWCVCVNSRRMNAVTTLSLAMILRMQVFIERMKNASYCKHINAIDMRHLANSICTHDMASSAQLSISTTNTFPKSLLFSLNFCLMTTSNQALSIRSVNFSR
jgi:hypothetical protein